MATTIQTTREKIKSKIEYKLSLSKNELVEETVKKLKHSRMGEKKLQRIASFDVDSIISFFNFHF